MFLILVRECVYVYTCYDISLVLNIDENFRNFIVTEKEVLSNINNYKEMELNETMNLKSTLIEYAITIDLFLLLILLFSIRQFRLWYLLCKNVGFMNLII